MDYCTERCKCGGKCKFPSNHGHILGRWEHICKNDNSHKWPVKITEHTI